MNEIDQLCDEEITLLDDRISSTADVAAQITNLFKDTSIVTASLELSREYLNRKEYAKAYQSLLHSMSYVIHIHQEILNKYSSIKNVNLQIGEDS